MRLLRRSLADDKFWKLIDFMGGEADETAVVRLRAALADRSRSDVVAFQERLAQALYDLDREDLATQPVRFVDDPADSEPIPLSNDTFLYLRAGIVAMGHATYAAVLADPSVLAKRAWNECEELLYVAEEVIGDDIDTKVSYETGSNQKYWTPPPERVRESWDQGVRPVVVDCRDLSDPIEGESFNPDGTTTPLVIYPSPKYIPRALTEELFMTFVKVIALNGGLPPSLRADNVQVQIDFGRAWHIQPEVTGPFEDTEFHVGQLLNVRVGVAADEVRAWQSQTRREGLLGTDCAMPTRGPAGRSWGPARDSGHPGPRRPTPTRMSGAHSVRWLYSSQYSNWTVQHLPDVTTQAP